MSDSRGKSIDDGMGRFGGEKLKQNEAQANALPDEHEHADGRRETREEDIVAAEFRGLDNDLIDMSNFGEDQPADDDGRGSTKADEDDPGLPGAKRDGNTERPAVSEYDRSRDA